MVLQLEPPVPTQIEIMHLQTNHYHVMRHHSWGHPPSPTIPYGPPLPHAALTSSDRPPLSPSVFHHAPLRPGLLEFPAPHGLRTVGNTGAYTTSKLEFSNTSSLGKERRSLGKGCCLREWQQAPAVPYRQLPPDGTYWAGRLGSLLATNTTARAETIENEARTSRISDFGLGGEITARRFSFSPH